MRWPFGRRPMPPTAPVETAPLETAPRFDASIDIAEPGAAERVRARVRALPGAGWISVEVHRAAATGVRLFPPGSSVEGEGGDWPALARAVWAAVRDALAEAGRAAPGTGSGTGWSVPAPSRAGFAEALAPSQFEALDRLASLARQQQPAAAPAPPPPEILPEDAEDVARLARLLGLVLPADALPAAAAAVRRFGSYPAALAAPEAELRTIQGLGTHCVAAIKLVHAAAIRHARAGVAAAPVLAERQRLYDYLAAALARERIEQFRILFLDERGMLKADEVQARGTVNHTPVYPREVVRRALALEAASLVLVHNHPSGDPAPSREDIEMTRQVREAAAVMRIALRDHVIVGNGRWLSFRDEGLLG